MFQIAPVHELLRRPGRLTLSVRPLGKRRGSRRLLNRSTFVIAYDAAPRRLQAEAGFAPGAEVRETMPTRGSELPSRELRAHFGDIDIYLFDQLLRGRFDSCRTLLDAGCGAGRNLVYFLRAATTVYGIDRDPAAIVRVRALAGELAPGLPPENFVAGDLDALPWQDQSMDAVLCSAVLHFAADEGHFGRMLQEMWRVLKPGGLFFARLASTIGLEAAVALDENRRARLPDGSERFLVDERFLLQWGERLGAVLLDPIKTTNVQNQRCMTTWVLQKRA